MPYRKALHLQFLLVEGLKQGGGQVEHDISHFSSHRVVSPYRRIPSGRIVENKLPSLSVAGGSGLRRRRGCMGRCNEVERR